MNEFSGNSARCCSFLINYGRGHFCNCNYFAYDMVQAKQTKERAHNMKQSHKSSSWLRLTKSSQLLDTSDHSCPAHECAVCRHMCPIQIQPQCVCGNPFAQKDTKAHTAQKTENGKETQGDMAAPASRISTNVLALPTFSALWSVQLTSDPREEAEGSPALSMQSH